MTSKQSISSFFIENIHCCLKAHCFYLFIDKWPLFEKGGLASGCLRRNPVTKVAITSLKLIHLFPNNLEILQKFDGFSRAHSRIGSNVFYFRPFQGTAQRSRNWTLFFEALYRINLSPGACRTFCLILCGAQG